MLNYCEMIAWGWMGISYYYPSLPFLSLTREYCPSIRATNSHLLAITFEDYDVPIITDHYNKKG